MRLDPEEADDAPKTAVLGSDNIPKTAVLGPVDAPKTAVLNPDDPALAQEAVGTALRRKAASSTSFSAT